MGTFEDDLLAAMGDRRGVGAADRLCIACVEVLGLDAAAISLVVDGANIGTLGASGTAARMYDEAQFTHGEGPCLDAVALGAPVRAKDLADPGEVRWPGYGSAMLAHRIRGVYAMPILVAGECVGAFDVFQAEAAELTVDQIMGVVEAAELAQIPVLDLLQGDWSEEVSKPGSDAWQELHTLTRAEVGQATGMLMAQLHLTASEALVRLRAHAYAIGRSATEVARDIVERRLRLDAD